MPPRHLTTAGTDRTGPALLLVVLLLAVLGPLLAAAPAGAVDTEGDPSPTAPPAAPLGAPWFGPGLDWTDDRADEYADRLGEVPSLYGQRVHYPLEGDDRTFLRQFVQQAATQGAVAVVDLEPQVALDDLTAADAQDLADELAGLHRELDTYFLVRFAPEMNGSWVTWGQQPLKYADAFRTVADAVHATTDQVAMVWSPAYGSGYPFGDAFGAVGKSGPSDTAALDTDGDGALTDADDPYGPYYPGDEAVDWVGLSLYYFGQRGAFGDNDLPRDGEYAERLDEEWGYATTQDRDVREPFYERFAREDQPMLVETGALFNPDGAKQDETALKQAWWSQVLAEAEDHPLVAGITWLERVRAEAEVGGATVDWRAAEIGDLAEALGEDLAASDVTLGPITRVLDLETGAEATAQGRQPADVGAEMGWIVFCVVLGALLFLLAGVVGRLVPSWRYPDEHDPRDRRLDLFRGFIILAVVVTHIEVAGPYTYVTLNAVGAITGAEMFVLLSGVVLGMIYEPTVRKLGERRTAVAMWKRARKQYLVSLAVIILVYVIGVLPFVTTAAITTFTDRGTGEDGSSTAGQVYDLYANFPRLFDYPPPWYAVKQLLLLEMGPWVFNIMGLFVVLSLLLPAMMWLVRRGLWWLLLAVSWVAFVYMALNEVHWLPSQFEFVFPLLTWQVAFTHGLVLGHYRARVQKTLTGRWGVLGCTVFVVGYAVSLGWIWLGHRFGVPTPFPDSSYAWLYANAYTRIFLQPGRLVDLAFMLVVTYAVLTRMWKPIDRVIGWLWIPLGQASLYVFIVHVFFALAVANVPGLDRAVWWQGLVVHTVVIGLVWVMVTRKVLFSVIPR